MSQNSAILQYLEQGNTLTPLEAYRLFGTLALHSRVSEIRERGYLIDCELVRVNGKQVGQYSLVRVAYG